MDKKRYLLDTCVLLAYKNDNDKYHNLALDFFKGLTNENNYQVHFSAITYLEHNKRIQILRRPYNTEPYNFRLPSEKIFQNALPLPIDKEYIDAVESNKLFDDSDFCGLGLGDFIHATQAYLYNFILVTLDGDFEKLKNKIKIVILK